MKIKSQNEKESRTQEIKRYLGALHEDYQGKLNGVIELVKGTNDKVDKMGDKVDKLEDKVDKMSDKLDGVVEEVGKISEDAEVIKGDIGVIKGDLKQKVDYREFTALERRVGTLESKVRK